MEIYKESGTTVTVEVPEAATSFIGVVARGEDSTQPAVLTSTTLDGYKTVPVVVPYAFTTSEGEVTVSVTFTIDNVQVTKTDMFRVVTPIIKRSAVPDISSADYNDLEPIVRHFLEVYCYQYFGTYVGVETIRGKGFDYIQTPLRLITMDSISFNEEEYDAAGFVVKDDGWLIKRANWETLTLKQAPPDPDTLVSNGIITAPYSRLNTTFWMDQPYAIDGVWGYEAVPTPVAQAAKLLMEDWSCQDAKYRNKYLENFRAADWRIQFKSQAFAGTGNLTADMLLNDYTRTRMEII